MVVVVSEEAGLVSAWVLGLVRSLSSCRGAVRASRVVVVAVHDPSVDWVAYDDYPQDERPCQHFVLRGRSNPIALQTLQHSLLMPL